MLSINIFGLDLHTESHVMNYMTPSLRKKDTLVTLEYTSADLQVLRIVQDTNISRRSIYWFIQVFSQGDLPRLIVSRQ